jgi:3D (Asp-Asp-Asp) domain-containing protein
MSALLAASLLQLLTLSSPARPVELNCSFYCGCKICTGVSSPEVGGHGLTTSQVPPVRGLTLAAPRAVPFGTAICIEGIGLRIVQDRGGSITGNRVDVYVRDPRDAPGHYELSHQLALELARHRLRAWVLGPGEDAAACEMGGFEER